MFYETFYKIGIKYINDLFIRDNSLESFNYWVNKGLQRSSLLTWYSLRSAAYKYKPLLQQLKTPEQTPDQTPSPLQLTVFTLENQIIEIKSNFKAKDFYIFLMQNQGITLPSNSNKLINDFNLQGEEELHSFFQLMHKVKADNKLKDLQYRILTSIYNTNVLLERKKY